MRVLWWNYSFWPTIGGVEVAGAELIRRLKERGHELVVVTQDEGARTNETDSFAGIPVHRFPFFSVLEKAELASIGEIRRALAQVVDEFRPDLIHIHNLGPQVVFHEMIFRSRSARLLVTRHELFDPQQPIGPDTIPVRTLRSADWVACCSRAVLEETHRLVPETAARSSVILNASAMPQLEPAELPLDPPSVLCIGRFTPQKGFQVAIEAFPRILARYPAARLVLIGDGPTRADLEARAASLGIETAVSFRGWVAPPDIPHEINDSTMVVLPSRYGEGFGLVALEAAQMGRPVIASRVGGVPEIVRDGVTGLLVEPDDASALSNAILTLLDHPESAASLGRAALRYSETFTFDRYADEYDALYRQLMEERIDVRTP